MAKLILGIGMSHSPMMATEGKYWLEFAKNDYHNPWLYDEAGRNLTYEELDRQREGRYALEATMENMLQLYQGMRKAFAQLKSDVAAASPDVMVVISNDHPGEFYDHWNVPALAIYCGDRLISASQEHRTRKRGVKRSVGDISEATQQMAKGMGMDKNHIWPGSEKVGQHLIQSLLDQGFDVGVLKEADDPTKNGHGHGFGTAVVELMDEDHLIPMVPVYINTWPPNVLSPSRCYDLGKALKHAIETMPEDLHIAVVASGGLSHFVTDQELDRMVLQAIRDRSESILRKLPRERLKGGNAEILNWVTLAAAVQHLELKWDQYLPVYRTPAGTGIGMTFAMWS